MLYWFHTDREERTMTKLERIQQTALKEKAAMLEGCKVSHIKSVKETHNGAIVEKRVGCPSIRIIPLEYWIGESFED
jgi:hypothetical protein